MKFELPQLPFKIDELEPFISRNTLRFHYGKLHQIYVGNLNRLVAGTRFEGANLETINRIADGPVYDNAAQIWNHSFYFLGMKPADNNNYKGPLIDIIKESFGSVSFFKKSFILSALSLFGSGWVWVVKSPTGLLEIYQESNSGNPLRRGLPPLLTCDVWEHAYYLDYQNRKQDYLLAFWNLINWEIIEKRYFDAS
jgi:superoxide dismutase, Fe-Mn family